MKLISILFILTSLLPACIMKEFQPVYERSVTAANYPSGSTVSYLENKFYVMGDDAAEILILGTDLKETGRIAIFPMGEQPRLPKASKADIEASVVINRDQKQLILFLGSGSVSPHRDSTFLLDPVSGEVTRLDSKSFFDELRENAREVNVEAAAMVDKDMVIGLRGNSTYPDNYIVVAGFDGMGLSYKRKILLSTPLGEAGISGMDYDDKEDILFITFSSEDTPNAYDDGQIGESYLAMVRYARSALIEDRLSISSVIKLSELSADLLHQKVESVSLMKDQRKLLLVADDDQGNTRLFIIKY